VCVEACGSSGESPGHAPLGTGDAVADRACSDVPGAATIWKAGVAAAADGRRRLNGFIADSRSRTDVRRTGELSTSAGDEAEAASMLRAGAEDEARSIPGSFSIWLTDGVRARAPDARDDGRESAEAERGGCGDSGAPGPHDEGPAAVSIPFVPFMSSRASTSCAYIHHSQMDVCAYIYLRTGGRQCRVRWLWPQDGTCNARRRRHRRPGQLAPVSATFAPCLLPSCLPRERSRVGRPGAFARSWLLRSNGAFRQRLRI
jgi:hypothetical protein